MSESKLHRGWETCPNDCACEPLDTCLCIPPHKCAHAETQALRKSQLPADEPACIDCGARCAICDRAYRCGPTGVTNIEPKLPDSEWVTIERPDGTVSSIPGKIVPESDLGPCAYCLVDRPERCLDRVDGKPCKRSNPPKPGKLSSGYVVGSKPAAEVGPPDQKSPLPSPADDDLAPIFVALRDSNVSKGVLDAVTERLAQARWLRAARKTAEAERDNLRRLADESHAIMDRALQAEAERDALRAKYEALANVEESAEMAIGLARLYLMKDEPKRALAALDKFAAANDMTEGERLA